jgi:hypothetical protein
MHQFYSGRCAHNADQQSGAGVGRRKLLAITPLSFVLGSPILTTLGWLFSLFVLARQNPSRYRTTSHCPTHRDVFAQPYAKPPNPLFAKHVVNPMSRGFRQRGTRTKGLKSRSVGIKLIVHNKPNFAKLRGDDGENKCTHNGSPNVTNVFTGVANTEYHKYAAYVIFNTTGGED